MLLFSDFFSTRYCFFCFLAFSDSNFFFSVNVSSPCDSSVYRAAPEFRRDRQVDGLDRAAVQVPGQLVHSKAAARAGRPSAIPRRILGLGNEEEAAFDHALRPLEYVYTVHAASSVTSNIRWLLNLLKKAHAIINWCEIRRKQMYQTVIFEVTGNNVTASDFASDFFRFWTEISDDFGCHDDKYLNEINLMFPVPGRSAVIANRTPASS